MAALALAFLPLATAAAQSNTIQYGRDVRPILADRCFRCHGPDPATREAHLRLDERDGAIAVREHGAAIVPFDPAQSLLWQRVHADDDRRMPPTRSGKPRLSPVELSTIERWILQGAEYEPHWAFVPPVRPEVPAGDLGPVDAFLAERRSAHGLSASPEADAETLVRRAFLVLTGLPPTPAELDALLADRAPDAYARLVDTLLDREPYRTRHAEHLAQRWLDAARYADTSGIHMDAGRQAWLWRDWLIAALRDDLPFDVFVRDQLAGDLLPAPTDAQRVATGFLRNHVTTDEGGAIDEEYRVEYAAERTATVGSVFLGLTVGCARCHDHKFDPIRQEDYFRIFSFFNSNQEPGLYSQEPDANRALEPFLSVPTAAQRTQRLTLEQEIASARRARDAESPDEQAEFAAFAASLRQAARTEWERPVIVAAESRNGATLTVEADGDVFASGANPATDVHVLTLAVDAPDQRWVLLEALPDARLPHQKAGRADNGNAVLQHVQLEVRSGAGESFRVVPFLHAVADVDQVDGDYAALNVLHDDRRGWAIAAHQGPPRPARLCLLTATAFGGAAGAELRLVLRYDTRFAQHVFGRVRVATSAIAEEALDRLPLVGGGFHVAGPFEATDNAALYATSFGPEQATAIDGNQRWGKVRWRFDHRLAVGVVHNSLPQGQNATYVAWPLAAASARKVQLALGSDDGFQLFLNGKLVTEKQIDRGAALDQDEAMLDLPAGPSLLVLKIVNTGGIGGFAIRPQPTAVELDGALTSLLWPQEGGAPEDAALQKAYRQRHSPHYRAQVAAVQRLEEDLAALDKATARAMVMQEAAEPRPTFVLTRGEYDKPDRSRPVARELPRMFGELPADAPRNRLGLAEWLVSAKNPLFDRVAVNRLWEFVFGQGLVRTSEDFGHQGEWPSHPELLDWLATEFRQRGHSVRHMLRLLVNTEAFRQQSRAGSAAAVDRDNRLWTWFPRRRLDAEAIRDQALYVSGLLVEQLGGPSVKPYQPDGLWREVAMTQSNTRDFVRGTGEALWRRSLYTYWKRACPPPSLLLLDAPTRESCLVRRTTTNTPLQVLALWNDEQFVEAARVLAEQVVTNEPDDDARLHAMYRRCTGHRLDDEALARCRSTLRSLQQRFQDDPAAAAAVLEVGEHTRTAQSPASEVAPFVLLANALLNLDATLWID